MQLDVEVSTPFSECNLTFLHIMQGNCSARMKIPSIQVINRFNRYCCILIDRQIYTVRSFANNILLAWGLS